MASLTYRVFPTSGAIYLNLGSAVLQGIPDTCESGSADLQGVPGTSC
jgi:hypothetical protein